MLHGRRPTLRRGTAPATAEPPSAPRSASRPPSCLDGRLSRREFLEVLAPLGLAAAGCGGSDGSPTNPDEPGDPRTPPPPTNEFTCNIPVSEIFDGGTGRNGIPRLVNPAMVAPDDPGAAFLKPTNRVIGIELEGEHMALPFNILNFHESINLDRGSRRVAVTFCPLTGSSLVFDRSAVDGAIVGVSGLILRNNQVLFDERPDRMGEVLWSQMLRRSVCGRDEPSQGTPLPLLPMVEMTWEGWRALHPDTTVVSSNTGFNRDYTMDPLVPSGYLNLNNDRFFFPRSRVDNRRPLKERLLGIPLGGNGGIAFPFLELDKRERTTIEQGTPYGRAVIFWDRAAQGAVPFFTDLDGERLTFEAVSDGFRDLESGSVWTLAGDAVEGPRAGQALVPFERAYTALWFAWADFQPETGIWVA